MQAYQDQWCVSDAQLPHHEPERWEMFLQYRAQDAVTGDGDRAPAYSSPRAAGDTAEWEQDQRINARGMCVFDTDLGPRRARDQ